MCTVSNDGKKLAAFFETRNPTAIAEGMRSVAHKMAQHVDEKLQGEAGGKEYDNKTKDLNQLFGMAAKLHALERPKGPAVQVNVGIQNNPMQAIAARDTRAIASQVMLELQQTHRPEEITDQMIAERIAYHEKQYELTQGTPIDGEIVE